MKFMDILTTAIRNLMKNKVRTILTILAIFIGSLAIFITAGVNIGVTSFLDQEIGGLGSVNVLQVVRDSENIGVVVIGSGDGEPVPYDEGDSELDRFTEDDMNDILAVNGITSVRPLTFVAMNNIRGESGDRYQFEAMVGLPNLNVNLLSGRYVNLDAEENEIVIDEEFIKPLGFLNNDDAIGEEIVLEIPRPDGETQDVFASIVGVQQRNALVAGSNTGWMNRALHEEIFTINMYGLPEAIADDIQFLEVLVENIEDIESVQETLNDMGFASFTIEDQVNAIMGFVNAVSGGLILFAIIALVAAVFGIINTLYMSVQERTREIGLMKALGLGKNKVFAVFCWEATLIGFFGSFFGLVVAMGLGAMINRLASDSFLSALPGLQLIQFTLVPSVVVITIIMFIAFLAGTLPARRASKLDPITALRTD